MAESSNQHLPVRAISLPSRDHPVCAQFEAILNHLKTWQIVSSFSETAPFGAESIQIGLVGVTELYTCVDEILCTPHAQRTILRNQSGKIVEEALDASVTLLDTCSILKETLLTMKENVLNLQSALRRKGTNHSSIESNVSAYVNARKKTQKDIEMCLYGLRKLERTRMNCSILSDSDASDKHLAMLARVITESNTIVISIFRSLLVFLSMPQKKKSLVSKLILFKRSSSSSFCDQAKGIIKDDFKSLDFSIIDLIREASKAENLKAEVKKIQTLLETLNVSVDSLDFELQCMSKCLVQNRVTLLNMFTH